MYKPTKNSNLSKNINDNLSNIITSTLSSHNELILFGDCNKRYRKKFLCEFLQQMALIKREKPEQHAVELFKNSFCEQEIATGNHK